MGRLILLRHAESVWNASNRFAGWTDVELTAAGAAQSQTTGELLAAVGCRPTQAYVSLLTRARRTLDLVLAGAAIAIPTASTWRLNERHYGILEGLDRDAAARQFGADRVARWRRGYADRPPPVAPDDPRHPRHDERYAGIADSELPVGESLADVVGRIGPLWTGDLEPALAGEQTVLVVSHGNTLRALATAIGACPVTDVGRLEIPICTPLLVEFDAGQEGREIVPIGGPGFG